jgi:hypothetical protein
MPSRRAGFSLCAAVGLWSVSSPSLSQEPCNHGYVWREAFAKDYVCVHPAVRTQVQKDNAATGSRYEAPGDSFACVSPYVRREAFAGDTACVTSERRDQVRRENIRAGTVAQPRPSGGSQGSTDIQGKAGGLTTPVPIEQARACRSGFVWREASPSDQVCVEPLSRQLVREENADQRNRMSSYRCKQGYVWREAGPTDYVCVEPAVREQARRDNLASSTRVGRFHEEIVLCDRYAREAVAQYHDMMAKSCRFTGPRWQGNYDAHYSWCLPAADRDRGGEAGARQRQLRECGARTESQNIPAPGEQCAASVTVRNNECLNQDGTPSSLQPGSQSAQGCGGNVDAARSRAKLSWTATFGCLSEDPTMGCCTVEEEVAAGCACQ